MNLPAFDREVLADVADPVGLDGIEFIEYSTTRPQALGQALEVDGVQAGRAPPLARGAAVPPGRDEHRRQRERLRRPAGGARRRRAVVAAIALRVRDAAAAYATRSSSAPGPCRPASK
jgi:4-hydroxyphenylpyruvate dioxygenase